MVNYFSFVGMLSCAMGETHVSRFLSTLDVSPPSKSCLRGREREVGHATENIAADSCKDAIREEINLPTVANLPLLLIRTKTMSLR